MATTHTILDPFSTVVYISLLAYLPMDTKLLIHDNRISFRPPGLLQPVLRYLNGESCYDMKFLQEPLRLWFKWILIHKKVHTHKGFLKRLHQGLDVLCDCYSKNEEIHTLLLSCKDIAEKMEKGIDTSSYSFFITNDQSPLYVNITSEIWKEEDFVFISQHFNFLDACNQENQQVYVHLIESYIEQKARKRLKDSLSKYSTT